MELLILNGIVNGLIVGGVYALIGVSLTLLYGVLRVVNFAHGEFVIAGSFFAYVLFSSLGVPPLLAAAGRRGRLLRGRLGRLLRADPAPVAQRRSRADVVPDVVRRVDRAAALMLLLFEADSRSIDYSFTPISVQVGPIYVSTARLVALAITVVISVALALFLFRTLPGKALRAAIMNREAIQIVGVDIVRLSAFAFALATALAGVTGVLVALVFPGLQRLLRHRVHDHRLHRRGAGRPRQSGGRAARRRSVRPGRADGDGVPAAGAGARSSASRSWSARSSCGRPACSAERAQR